MSIKTIQQAFSTLQKLTKKEKDILADFERRIGILYKHKILVRKITKDLANLKKKEELKPKKFKSKKELESIEKSESTRKSVLKHIEQLASAIHTAFYSLKLPESLENLPEKDILIIQDEINKEVQLFEFFKTTNTEAAKRITEQLKKILVVDKTETDLITEFENRIKGFKKILNSQYSNIKAELDLLSEMQQKISEDEIIPTEIDSWDFSLNNCHKNIRRLLKSEKDLIHDSMYKLIKGTRRASRLGKRLSEKKGVTIKDVKQDIQTFNKPEEYTFYYSSLIKSGMLSENVKKFLDKGVYFSSIAEEKKSFKIKSLTKFAFIDELTQLNNRHYFKKEVKKIMEYEIRSNIPISFSLLIIDIDFFKKFNDTYGHDIGDIVLKEVAGYIKSIAKRDSDLTIRWGGEEFVVLLNNTNKRTAMKMVEKLRSITQIKSQMLMNEDINPKYAVKEKISEITISIGMVMYPQDIRKDLPKNYKPKKIIDILIKKADERLYSAKARGRNQIVAYD